MEITVRCGCTRTMQTDTYAGAQRYRCSCGARVGLYGLPKLDATHCSLYRGGRVCNGPKDRDAPTCQPCMTNIARHAMNDPEVVELLAGKLADVDFYEIRQGQLDQRKQLERERLEKFERRDDARRCCVVYYCRIRPGVIKIGTTIQLAVRMDSFRLPADAVLAAEPGSYQLENMRHRQFEQLRIHPRREDFHLDDSLQTHIDNLVRIHGQPYDLANTILERQLELASRGTQS